MRILITTGIFPPDIGGPATQIEHLASGLAGAGFGVSVLTYGSPENKKRNYELTGVSRKLGPLKQVFYGIKTFMLAQKTDAIYTTDLYSPGYFSMLAAKFWKKKFVVRFAGDSAWETALNKGLTQDGILEFQDKKYNSFIEKLKGRRARILKSADTVVAVSNFMKDLAVKIGVDSRRVSVIYNAVDFRDNLPKHENSNAPTLVFVGRLVPWKGVEMLINAVSKLKNKYPDIMLEILGDGPEMKNLQLITDNLKLKNNINFRGRINSRETMEILAKAAVFVLNTNYEGLPHTVLEAMSIGVPVITTPVGGNVEVVQNGINGLLARYNDEGAWIKAISELLNDANLRKKLAENAKKMLEKFKWEELMAKTVEVFKKL
ncbi:MAG: glycosyltransferase family 4 protein [Candidatus Pacebacteria bacterium]|nr:glycosyltransferase family 4 protein [Candidatus Paceibacterota bacterium]